MTRETLLELFDAGDLYGLLLAVGREWLRKHHPESGHAMLIADHGDDLPATQIMLFPSEVSVVA